MDGCETRGGKEKPAEKENMRDRQTFVRTMNAWHGMMVRYGMVYDMAWYGAGGSVCRGRARASYVCVCELRKRNETKELTVHLSICLTVCLCCAGSPLL